MSETFDKTALQKEIDELEEERAAEVRQREEALEREQRGPVGRGMLRRINEGIKAGRAEMREKQAEAARARAEQEKVYEEYDREHPSNLGKTVGRALERTTPVVEPVAKTVRSAAAKTRSAATKTRAAVRKQARATRKAVTDHYKEDPAKKKKRSTPRRSPLDGLDGMLIGSSPAPARKKRSQGRSAPVGGLDDMLISAPSRKKKKSSRRKSDDDYLGLGGGFRLL